MYREGYTHDCASILDSIAISILTSPFVECLTFFMNKPDAACMCVHAQNLQAASAALSASKDGLV